MPDDRDAAESLPPAVIHASACGLINISGSATARTRVNLAVQHLLTAARLAKAAREVELHNKGKEFGSFWEELFGACVGCVMLAQAALEAYVNETFADRADHFQSRDQALIELLWLEYERKPVLDKFDLALRLRANAQLDLGTGSTQSVARLVDLRNALVHFHPEWHDERAFHAKLSKRLDGYVTPSEWFVREAAFPRAWASGVTASWAVRAVIDFVAAFSSQSGIPDRVAQFRERITSGL